ncbi:succinate dehydrogenase flavoprotein subunit [Pantoea sp. DY-5]|nr:succinate dehydrogenase flavoprotein subunit [Pantoea sp. DY-5]MBY4841154.1 succinate dehydrogenase flavoprotein subunit [Pantoea sp. DY-5]
MIFDPQIVAQVLTFVNALRYGQLARVIARPVSRLRQFVATINNLAGNKA